MLPDEILTNLNRARALAYRAKGDIEKKDTLKGKAFLAALPKKDMRKLNRVKKKLEYEKKASVTGALNKLKNIKLKNIKDLKVPTPIKLLSATATGVYLGDLVYKNKNKQYRTIYDYIRR